MIALPDWCMAEPTQEKRGRPKTYHDDKPATPLERKRRERGKKTLRRLENIAVLDMETDPFDASKPNDPIRPFVACLMGDQFETQVIWDDDFEQLVARLLSAIEQLPPDTTIYAHNGGKFDYLFFVHKLQGRISFKGRGIMSARIGECELRDSFHIIPEKLASYKKDDFDYEKMRKSKRHKHKAEIIEYLINDCRYLLDLVKGFTQKFGMKISIGQAAMAELKNHYSVGSIGANTDASLREWFYGGRVECLAGKGQFRGNYNLYDVNSMYPYAMANYQHPISANYALRRKGDITEKTVFLELQCRNYGALVGKDDEGATTTQIERGTFKTTIWEYEAARELGLIEDVKITGYIDNDVRSDFAEFVNPLYENRLATKAKLKELAKAGLEETREYADTKKDDIFYKLLLNNAYGKFAQNPRRYKENYITKPNERPEEKGWDEIILPAFECRDYWIWQRPIQRLRFNNVGTAASITGAARAVLMRAIANALDPIYCDTDSLICKSLDGVEIHPQKLGAWDLEAEYSEVLIAGKKLYACRDRGQTDKIKVKSKGVSGLTWGDMEKLLADQLLPFLNHAPTLTKTGAQHYMERRIRATAPSIPGQTYRYARRSAA